MKGPWGVRLGHKWLRDESGVRRFATSEDADRAAAQCGGRASMLGGFTRMDREIVKQLAMRGGQAAHACGRAHEFSPSEAREAGRKGGIAAHAKKRTTPSKSRDAA